MITKMFDVAMSFFSGITLSLIQVNVNVDQMQVFVITTKAGMKMNTDVHGKNRLTKFYEVKDLFGIHVISNETACNV